jgi:hypothetical protein
MVASVDRLIVFERARSGRSKCCSSQQPIALGEMRVGITTWRMGRSCVAWQKAESFVERGMYVDVAKTGTASCKISGEKQPRGTLRFAVRTGPSSQFYMGIDEGAPLVKQALCAAGKQSKDLTGLDELEGSDRKSILASCAVSKTEREIFDRKHATVLGSAVPSKVAKKRKRVSRAAEEESSSGDD